MKTGLLAALFLLSGCDSAYVREHIIDNFVCVYAPWWMFSDGDCQNSETVAKVESVLDHGMMEAQARCPFTADVTGLFGPADFTYSESLMMDGTAIVSVGGVVSQTNVWTRGSSEAASGLAAFSFASPSRHLNLTLESGFIRVHCADCGPGSDPDDEPDLIDISSYPCTGFNLEAFGVE